MKSQIRTKAQGPGVRALTDGGEGAPSAAGREPSKLYPPVSVSRGARRGVGPVPWLCPSVTGLEFGSHYPGDFHCLGYWRRVSYFSQSRLRGQK